MKKILSLALILVLTLGVLCACGGEKAENVIRVGASSTPHAVILEFVKDDLAKAGYTLEIVVYDDYVLPNKGVSDGELDANYFQHTPYLNSYNADNKTEIVSAGLVHYEHFGVYGNGVTDLASLAAGATILIPADDSNATRALFLLQQEGLIALPADASAEIGVSHLDIVDNGGYNIVPVEAQMVSAQLKNSDVGTIAVINGNFAIGAGFKIADALASEDASGEAVQAYANIVAVQKGNETSPKIQALVEALQTEKVATYIADTFAGAAVAIK